MLTEAQKNENNGPRTQKKQNKNPLRFGNGVADDISISSGMRAPVLAAYAILRSRALPDVPAKYSFIQEEIEQLTVCKVRSVVGAFNVFFRVEKRERKVDSLDSCLTLFFLLRSTTKTKNSFSTAAAHTGAR
jgi:hypothetical protein